MSAASRPAQRSIKHLANQEHSMTTGAQPLVGRFGGDRRLTRLLAISGSLRRRSYNKALLETAQAATSACVEFVVWSRLPDIPAYSEDLVAPPAVELLRSEIARSDAILIATPEYNGSIPGALKN